MRFLYRKIRSLHNAAILCFHTENYLHGMRYSYVKNADCIEGAVTTKKSHNAKEMY